MLFQAGNHQLRRDFPFHGKSGHDVSSEYFRACSRFFQLSQGLFNALRCFAADQQAIFLADRTADSFVELQTARLDQTAEYDASQGKDGNLRGIIAHVHYQDALGILYIDIKAQAVCHRLFHHHDFTGLHIGVLDQIIKGALLHLRNIGGHRNIEVGRLDIASGHIRHKKTDQSFHILNIGDNSVAERIGNLDIAGGLFIHFIGGIPISENGLLVLHGDHVFFNHDLVIRRAVNLNVART